MRLTVGEGGGKRYHDCAIHSSLPLPPLHCVLTIGLVAIKQLEEKRKPSEALYSPTETPVALCTRMDG